MGFPDTVIDDTTQAIVASAAGLTIYALFFNGDGQVWNGTTFETYDSADWATYDVPMTEIGSGHYHAAKPTFNATHFVAYSQAGGTPATTDKRIAQGIV